MRHLLALIRQNGNLLLFGFLLTCFSGFGQTFFVSLFVPYIQKYFQLSDSLFSSFYAIATLMSAAMLTWAGRFIDTVRLPKFTIRVMTGLAFSLIFLSQAYFFPMLIVGLFGIRLFGQGLMTHTSLTSMGKFFDFDRGKAISIAALGHPAGEAVFPIVFVSLIGAIGWRYSLVVAGLLVFMLIPLVLYFLFKENQYAKLKLFLPSPKKSQAEVNASKPWNVFKSRAFLILAPSNFASASIGTAFIFFQLKIGAERGWSPTWMAGSFAAYAIAGATGSIVGGLLTDRFSAKKMYPIILLPFLTGLTAFYFIDSPWVYPLFLAGIGMTNGFSNTVKNSALAEMYGIAFLGSVRSVFITVMIFSTAIGPVLFGFLFDLGFTFHQLILFSMVAMVLSSINSLRIFRI
ncbi:MAG: hypothetical protein CO119_11015 [Flavobacteriales bacterium CG_4_9_14_3_um_filter_40_17]|nr:MAG: hypothetical protein CO119_11015 [Flavobacteriales bacterium CG_4_9_14_3_um_filter_40_17]